MNIYREKQRKQYIEKRHLIGYIVIVLIVILIRVLLGYFYLKNKSSSSVNSAIAIFQKVEIAIALIPITLGLAVIRDTNKLYLGKSLGYLLLIRKKNTLGYWELMLITLSIPFINIFFGVENYAIIFGVIFIINIILVVFIIKKTMDILYIHRNLNKITSEHLKNVLMNGKNGRIENFSIIYSINKKLSEGEEAIDEIEFLKELARGKERKEGKKNIKVEIYIDSLFKELIKICLVNNRLDIIDEILDEIENENRYFELTDYSERVITCIIDKLYNQKKEVLEKEMIELAFRVHNIVINVKYIDDSTKYEEIINNSYKGLEAIHSLLIENEERDMKKVFYLNLEDIILRNNLKFIDKKPFYKRLVNRETKYAKDIKEFYDTKELGYIKKGTETILKDKLDELIDSLFTSKIKNFKFDESTFIKYDEYFKLMALMKRKYVQNLLENENIKENIKWNIGDILKGADTVIYSKLIRENEKGDREDREEQRLSKLTTFIEVDKMIEMIYEYEKKIYKLKEDKFNVSKFQILLRYLKWITLEHEKNRKYEGGWIKYKYNWIICLNNIMYFLDLKNKEKEIEIERKQKSYERKRLELTDKEKLLEIENKGKKELEIEGELQSEINKLIMEINELKRENTELKESFIIIDKEIVEYREKTNKELFEEENFIEYLMNNIGSMNFSDGYQSKDFKTIIYMICLIKKKNSNINNCFKNVDMLCRAIKIEKEDLEEIERFLGVSSTDVEKIKILKRVKTERKEVYVNTIIKKEEDSFYRDKRKEVIDKSIFPNLIKEQYSTIENSSEEIIVYINFEDYYLHKIEKFQLTLTDFFSLYRENNNMNEVKREINSYLVKKLKKIGVNLLKNESEDEEKIFLDRMEKIKRNKRSDLKESYEFILGILKEYNRINGEKMRVEKNEELAQELSNSSKKKETGIEIDISEERYEYIISRLTKFDEVILRAVLEGKINPKVRVGNIEIAEIEKNDVEKLVKRIFKGNEDSAYIKLDFGKIEVTQEEYRKLLKCSVSKIKMQVEFCEK